MASCLSLTVKRVRNGLGIVTAKPIRQGATIVEIKGKIVTAGEVWRYWKIDSRLAGNCFRYDEEHYLDPDGEIGQYANHSCNPNSGIIKNGRRLILKAIASIAAGEEVTHDYSTLLGADDGWEMRCNCHASNCRGMVRNIGNLSAATVCSYRRLGIVPDFILATIWPSHSPSMDAGGNEFTIARSSTRIKRANAMKRLARTWNCYRGTSKRIYELPSSSETRRLGSWLNPAGRATSESSRLLDERSRPYYEHQLAS